MNMAVPSTLWSIGSILIILVFCFFFGIIILARSKSANYAMATSPKGKTLTKKEKKELRRKEKLEAKSNLTAVKSKDVTNAKDDLKEEDEVTTEHVAVITAETEVKTSVNTQKKRKSKKKASTQPSGSDMEHDVEEECEPLDMRFILRTLTKPAGPHQWSEASKPVAVVESVTIEESHPKVNGVVEHVVSQPDAQMSKAKKKRSKKKKSQENNVEVNGDAEDMFATEKMTYEYTPVVSEKTSKKRKAAKEVKADDNHIAFYSGKQSAIPSDLDPTKVQEVINSKAVTVNGVDHKSAHMVSDKAHDVIVSNAVITSRSKEHEVHVKTAAHKGKEAAPASEVKSSGTTKHGKTAATVSHTKAVDEGVLEKTVTDLRNTVAKLEKELQTRTSEAQRLRDNSASAVREHEEHTRLRKTHQELEERTRILQGEFTKNISTLSTAQRTASVAEARARSVEEKLANFNKEKSTIEAQLTSAQNELHQKKSLIAEKEQENQELKNLRISLMEAVKQDRQMIESERAKNGLLQSERQEMLRTINMLESERRNRIGQDTGAGNEQLKNALEEYRSKIIYYESRENSLRAHIGDLELRLNAQSSTSTEKEELQTEVAELKTKMAALEAQFTAELSRTQETCSVAQRESHELKEQMGSLSSQHAHELSQKESVLEEMRLKIAESAALIAASSADSGLKDHIGVLEKKLEEAAEKERGGQARANEEIASLKEKVGCLEKELSDVCAKTTEEGTSAEKENETLKRRVGELEKELCEISSKAADEQRLAQEQLNGEICTLKETISTLECKLTQSSEKAENEKQMIKELTDQELSHLKERISSLERELNEEKERGAGENKEVGEITGLKERVTGLEKELCENREHFEGEKKTVQEKYDAEISDLKARIATLETELHDAKEHSQNIERSTREAADNEVEGFKAQISHLEKELCDAKENAMNEGKRAEERLESETVCLKERIASLEKELHERSTAVEAANGEITSLKESIASTEKELSETKEKASNERQALQEKADGEIAALKEKITVFEKQLCELRETTATEQKSTEEVESLKKQISVLEKEISAVKMKSAAEVKMMELEAAADTRKLKANVTRLETELKEVTCSRDDFEKKIAELTVQISVHQANGSNTQEPSTTQDVSQENS